MYVQFIRSKCVTTSLEDTSKHFKNSMSAFWYLVTGNSSKDMKPGGNNNNGQGYGGGGANGYMGEPGCVLFAEIPTS